MNWETPIADIYSTLADKSSFLWDAAWAELMARKVPNTDSEVAMRGGIRPTRPNPNL